MSTQKTNQAVEELPVADKPTLEQGKAEEKKSEVKPEVKPEPKPETELPVSTAKKASKPKAKKTTAKPKTEKVQASKGKETAKKANSDKKKTMHAKLISALKSGAALSVRRGQEGFLSLKEIYSRCGVSKEDVGATAAIRGILNLDHKEKRGEFERSKKIRGAYRLRGEKHPQGKTA